MDLDHCSGAQTLGSSAAPGELAHGSWGDSLGGIVAGCYGCAQVQQVWLVRLGLIRSPADKYTVMGVKALVKLLTNTLKKTLRAYDVPD